MHPDNKIKKIKPHDEGTHLRLTFDWPQEITQVLISTRQDPTTGKLFTLEEYKKQSGYTTQKLQGITTYYIYPSQRENGEDITFPPTHLSYTNRTIIDITIKEKSTQHKNHNITISTNYPVTTGILCYTKKENTPPQNQTDGVFYPITEPLEPNKPITRIIRTNRNEYINFFIQDLAQEELYELRSVR